MENNLNISQNTLQWANWLSLLCSMWSLLHLVLALLPFGFILVEWLSHSSRDNSNFFIYIPIFSRGNLSCSLEWFRWPLFCSLCSRNQSKVVPAPQMFYLIMALLSYMIFQWLQVYCQHMKTKFFSSFLQNVNNCNTSQGLHISCCCLNGNGRWEIPVKQYIVNVWIVLEMFLSCDVTSRVLSNMLYWKMKSDD